MNFWMRETPISVTAIGHTSFIAQPAAAADGHRVKRSSLYREPILGATGYFRSRTVPDRHTPPRAGGEPVRPPLPDRRPRPAGTQQAPLNYRRHTGRC